MIDVEEDLRTCASRKKELKTLSKKLVTDVNDAKTRIDEELKALQATGGGTSSATTPKQHAAVASRNFRCEARLGGVPEARKQAQMALAGTMTRHLNICLPVAKFQAARYSAGLLGRLA